MRVKTLNQRHPSVDPALLRRYDALYRGGPAFKRLLADFLPANPAEAGDVYALRKRDAASYRGYVGTLADFFASQLFASSFAVRALDSSGTTAEPDPYYSRMREDCDGNGLDLIAFLRRAFTEALVDQTSWILAEMPADDGEEAADREEWERRGLGRARLRCLDAVDVLDWETDDVGALRWAITYCREARRDDPRLERTLITETWKLYDEVDVETFSITYDPAKRKLKADDVIPSLGKVPHRFPRVPLIPLRMPDGMWLLGRAADAQIEHFRLSAALSWSLKRAAYPMLVYKATDPDASPIPTTGAGFALKIGKGEELTWVGPGSAPFEVLSTEIANQRTELHRLVSQMAASIDNSASALDRSGLSKQADQAATLVCLHGYAGIVKQAAEAVYELVSDGRGDVDITFSVEGLDSFDLDSIAASLANIKEAMGLSIPSPTLKAELQKKAAALLLPDAEQGKRDKINAEIEEAATKPTPAPPPPAGEPADPNPGDVDDGEPTTTP